jgi:tetratricopeptide (TPR) repeat protein
MHESPKALFFDRLAALVLTITLGVMPIFFIPFFGVGLSIEKAYFVGLGVLVTLVFWVIARMIQGSISFPKSPLIWLALLLPVAFFLSALFSPAPQVSLGGLALSPDSVFGMLSLSLVFLGSIFYFNNEYRIKLLAKIILIVTAIATLFQVVYEIFGPRFLSFGNFTTNVSNMVGSWNDLALWYAFIAIGIILAFEFLDFTRKKRILIGVMLFFALVFLALVNFIFAWSVLALFSLVIFVYSLTILRQSHEEPRFHFPAAPFVVLLVSLFFFLANPIAGGFLSSKLHISQTEIRPLLITTLAVDGQALRNHPLVGVGPSRFSNAWFLYQPKNIIATQFWDTSFSSGFSYLTSIPATLGIFGILPMLAFIILFLMMGFVQVFRTGYEKRTHFYLLLSFMLALYGWVIVILYNPGIVGLTFAFAASGIFVSILSANGRIVSREINFLKDPRQSFFTILFLVFVLLGSLFLVFAGGEKFFSLVDYVRAQSSFSKNDLTGGSALLAQSIALYPADTYYRTNSLVALQSLQNVLSNNSLSKDILQSEFQSIFGGAQSAAQGAIAYDRTNPQNWTNVASLYQTVVPLNVSGAYANAKAALDQLAVISPNSPAVDYMRAQLDIVNKDQAAAKTDVQNALTKKPNYIDAIFLLAQLEASGGDITTAITQLETAASANPRDPSVYLELGLFKYNNSDYAGAVSALERSVTLDPTSLNAHYFLALSYDKVGRTSDALAVLNSIAKALPNDQDIPKIIANINAGNDPLLGLTTTPTTPLPSATGSNTTDTSTINSGSGTSTSTPTTSTTTKIKTKQTSPKTKPAA